MTYVIYTDDERAELVRKFAHLVSTTDKPFTKICAEDLGGITLYRVKKLWVKDNAELQEVIAEACMQRAYRYQEKAEKVALDVIDKWWWTAETTEQSSKFGTLTRQEQRERTTAVNSARLQIDVYMGLARMLCPEDFSDYSKEIKDLLRKIDEIDKKIS